MIKVKLIDYYYYNNYDDDEEFNAPVLVWKTRDKDGNLHQVQILDKEKLAPHFGVLKEDFDNFILNELDSKEAEYITRWEEAPDSVYKEKVMRFYTTFPWQVPRIRDKEIVPEVKFFKQTFQADVKWEKMATSLIVSILDLDGAYVYIPDDYMYKFLKVSDLVKVEKKDFFFLLPRVCYWDIESDSRDFGSKIVFEDLEKLPIVSITCDDSYTGEYAIFTWHYNIKENIVTEYNDYVIPDNVDPKINHTIKKVVRYECKTEIEMLKQYFDYMGTYKYDVDFGYFSAGGWKKIGKHKVWQDGFDILNLFQRSKKLGLIEDMQKMSTCPVKKDYKDRFDAVKMRSFGGKHRVAIKGMGHIDFVFSEAILMFAQKYYKFRGHKLAHWAEFFLNYHKLDKKGRNVWEFWEQNDFESMDNYNPNLIIENGLPRIRNKGFEFMLDYNLIDVKICDDLDKRFNVTKNQSGRGEVSLSPIDDCLEASKLHDHFKLTKFQRQYSFDTKYQRYKRPEINGKDQIGNNFTITLKDLENKARASGRDIYFRTLKDIGKVGGYVPVPVPGIYEDMAVIDFSKYYPNMIKSTNAGIVSAINVKKIGWFCVIDKEGRVWDRKDIIETPIAFFRKDVKALNSLLFDKWMTKRVTAQKKLKDYVKIYKTTKTDRYKTLWSEQFNIKNFMNAGFGVLGLSIDRIYSQLVFNSCTVSCQDGIFLCTNILKDFGIELRGGDTDSTFIQLYSKGKQAQIKEAKRICEWLNRCLRYYFEKVYNINPEENTIKIGLETISDKFFIDTMKHYIKRNWYAEGVILEKKEIEIKGMDLKKRATSVVGSELQTGLADILFDAEDPVEAIKDYVLDFDQNLESRSWTELCKHGPLNKELDKYPDSNESARAARNTLKYLGRYYGPGSNPFLGVFKHYPPKFKGKFISEIEGKEDFKMSFEAEDEQMLRDANFILNYDKIREAECHNKTSGFLALFQTDYQSIAESASVGDLLAI